MKKVVQSRMKKGDFYLKISCFSLHLFLAKSLLDNEKVCFYKFQALCVGRPIDPPQGEFKATPKASSRRFQKFW